MSTLIGLLVPCTNAGSVLEISSFIKNKKQPKEQHNTAHETGPFATIIVLPIASCIPPGQVLDKTGWCDSEHHIGWVGGLMGWRYTYGIVG